MLLKTPRRQGPRVQGPVTTDVDMYRKPFLPTIETGEAEDADASDEETTSRSTGRRNRTYQETERAGHTAAETEAARPKLSATHCRACGNPLDALLGTARHGIGIPHDV